jgi:hypothetical protein
MTQQEFTNRTQVEVSYNEFNAIHEVYMNSDLDKDEFCKMWVKMNKTRVQRAKEEAKAEAYEAKKREFLYDFINQDFDWSKLVAEYVSYEESKKFKAYGFDVEEPYFNTGIKCFKSISTFVYEIKKYLKTA